MTTKQNFKALTCQITEAITIASCTFRFKGGKLYVGSFSYKPCQVAILFQNLKAIGFKQSDLSRLKSWIANR